MPLPRFELTGNLNEVLPTNTSGELDIGPLTSVALVLTSNIRPEEFVTWDGELYRVSSVHITVNADGTISDVSDPVLLLANDPDLNFSGLQWKVSVRTRFNDVAITEWWFDAPEDGEVIDLATVVPVPGAQISNLAEMPLSGLSGATNFMKNMIGTADDAAEARSILGLSLFAIDDVVWFDEFADFPATGEVDTVYGARDTGKLYIWDAVGLAYEAIRGAVTAADIIDASTSGRTILTGTPTAARAALDLKVVTPEDFGAVGDGVTDNATALRNMFLSAVANGGVNIHIPWGETYASSLPIDVKDNTFVYGSGTIKCLAEHSAGGFILLKNAVHNVTWIGPTLDIDGVVNMNGFAVGDVPNSTDFVSDIYIVATVTGARIKTALEDTNDALYSGGGKGITVQFRARNVYANIRAEDNDISCSIEAAVSNTRYLENVVLDIQSKDAHRTHLFIGGSKDPSVSSSDSGSYVHSLYPGCKIRLRAQGGQDASITNPVTSIVGANYDHAGVVTLNYASGIDLEVYAATVSRCTLIRGMASASTIRVTNALMDALQDVWDTRPIDTLPTPPTIMSDNVFEANVHAKTHHGILVRPHRDTGSPTMQRAVLDVSTWCQDGIGAITQDDAGVTDSFGASVAYRFRDMKASPVKQISGLSSDDPKPQWALAPNGGSVATGNKTANNHIAARESTVTAAGTTTLDLTSAQVQVFTGSTTQTVRLPSAGVVAGQSYTIVNQSSSTLSVQSSGTGAIVTQFPTKTIVFTAVIDTPSAAGDWQITGMAASSSASTQTLAMRDTNGNLTADNFIATATSTVTAAGTTTLTVNSAQTQVFTGSTTQTVVLPTTGIIAGQSYTIINQGSSTLAVQSSNTNAIITQFPSKIVVYTALVDTPTTSADWQITDMAASSIASTQTLAMRDTNGNLTSDCFIATATSTATAAGTTTLTINSAQTQVFTGSTTQTCVLPTTGIVAGQWYAIINNSSGAVTVNASGGATVAILPAGSAGIFVARVTTPTTAGNWGFIPVHTTPPITRTLTTVTTTLTGVATVGVDYVYFLSAGAAFTLPTAVGNTNQYTIKNIDSGAHNIATTSSQTIDGAAAPLSIAVNEAVTLISDGANWRIV